MVDASEKKIKLALIPPLVNSRMIAFLCRKLRFFLTAHRYNDLGLKSQIEHTKIYALVNLTKKKIIKNLKLPHKPAKTRIVKMQGFKP